MYWIAQLFYNAKYYILTYFLLLNVGKFSMLFQHIYLCTLLLFSMKTCESTRLIYLTKNLLLKFLQARCLSKSRFSCFYIINKYRQCARIHINLWSVEILLVPDTKYWYRVCRASRFVCLSVNMKTQEVYHSLN